MSVIKLTLLLVSGAKKLPQPHVGGMRDVSGKFEDVDYGFDSIRRGTGKLPLFPCVDVLSFLIEDVGAEGTFTAVVAGFT
ncbi:hypothetical protein PSE_3838 [Pseudovibrio sp. FO-BEG1]|nr:hypothetical protein PSE_3838 [Pseudovibrio sp. FO-BEG1]